MKKILVPIDFSEVSLNALEFALEIAARRQASIEVLHAYKFPAINQSYAPVSVYSQLMEGQENKAIAEFTEFIKQSSKRTQDLIEKVSINFTLQMGFVPDVILTNAKEKRVDLIVMGTTGASGIKAAFLGSIAGEVMENAYCPVLAIPKNAKFNGVIRKIGVTSDFTDDDKKVFDYMLNWAMPFNAEVICFHVDLNHTHDYTQKMNKLASHYIGSKNTDFEVIDEQNLQVGIERFVKDKNIDVLAMLINKRSFFRELFHYSTAKNLSYHSNIPILAIQSHIL